MYSERKPWGCKWFEKWREQIESAVALKQRLIVYFFEGRIGEVGRYLYIGRCIHRTEENMPSARVQSWVLTAAVESESRVICSNS
jgi:hypothetical protein